MKRIGRFVFQEALKIRQHLVKEPLSLPMFIERFENEDRCPTFLKDRVLPYLQDNDHIRMLDFPELTILFKPTPLTRDEFYYLNLLQKQGHPEPSFYTIPSLDHPSPKSTPVVINLSKGHWERALYRIPEDEMGRVWSFDPMPTHSKMKLKLRRKLKTFNRTVNERRKIENRRYRRLLTACKEDPRLIPQWNQDYVYVSTKKERLAMEPIPIEY